MNPLPATVAALTVTADAPVDVRVIVCVAAVFTFTLPKARLAVLTPNVIVDAPNCRPNVLVMPPVLADNVTACATLTAEAFAVNDALMDPGGTVTVAGTVTAVLLLARVTACPPLGAPEFSVIVQLSVPAPVIDPLTQLSVVSTGTPLPAKVTFFEFPSAELLFSVN